ncbi:hypothetical protein [Streptomyces flavofungini]|uniref:hypothetical protein n=1 Tax=Streptomyces flavofungini TaxID=68200 RepID=UPI0034DE6473
MKNVLRGIGAGSLALACVFAGSGGAEAATAHGKAYYGCTNYVKVWRSGSKVYAYGWQTCDKKRSVQRPEAAISSYKGGSLKDYSGGRLGGCHNTKSCKSPTVSLKAHKGYKYRATNTGTASIGIPDEGDYIWPKRTQAVKWYTAS